MHGQSFSTGVTTIAMIAMLGNQYCVSLLREAQAASGEGDWPLAQQCLRRCADQLGRILRAEGELLYPRLILKGAGRGRLPTDLRQQQALIGQRAQQIVACAAARDMKACGAGIEALVELLSAYWQSERALFQSLAGDERLLASFAARLQPQPGDLDTPPP